MALSAPDAEPLDSETNRPDAVPVKVPQWPVNPAMALQRRQPGAKRSTAMARPAAGKECLRTGP